MVGLPALLGPRAAGDGVVPLHTLRGLHPVLRPADPTGRGQGHRPPDVFGIAIRGANGDPTPNPLPEANQVARLSKSGGGPRASLRPRGGSTRRVKLRAAA